MEDQIIKKLFKLVDKAILKNEVPVAAIITCDNKIIAKSHNIRTKNNDTLGHAEILVIKKANKKLKSWRLNECSLYVTVKPCEMCEKIIKESRIKKVYYLIDRPVNKKQFSKTKFSLLTGSDNEIYKSEYMKKMQNFWKNKR